jgi:hypothetical protein
LVRWLSKNRDKGFLIVFTGGSTGAKESHTAEASEYPPSREKHLTT